MPKYKYNELELLNQLKEYIDSTYIQEGENHYAQGDIELTEFNIDQGFGEGFTHGNINKYNNRYGKKDGYNRKDIMKTLYYGIMALYVHDLERSNEES